MVNKYKILILYAEVMDYQLGAIQQFKKEFPNSDILLFELDKQKKTTFTFSPDKFIYYKKSDFELYRKFKAICVDFDPDVILVSGRMHKHYLQIAKFFKRLKKYTVTLQDTQYEKSFRQEVIRLFSKYLYHRYFCAFWGAGNSQYAFALSLGFRQQDIFSGIYTANDEFFNDRNISTREIRDKNRKILFVGRLEYEKNVLKLAEVIERINRDQNMQHVLYVFGDGALKNQLTKLECVRLNSFTDPKTLALRRNEFDFFCLPSIYEPWGVVVHEFALLGMPLLLSYKVGARSEFLVDGYNGYTFNPYSLQSIYETISGALMMNDSEIKLFGERSASIAKRLSRVYWSASLNSICQRAESLKRLSNSQNS